MGFLDKEKFTPIRPFQIGEQLPYLEFETNEESSVWRAHLLQDGALAMAWKTNVPASYSQDNGHVHANNELRTFIENLPAGYEVQLIITSHNNLMSKMKKYLALDSGVEQGAILRRSRAEKLLDSGFNGYQVAEGAWTMLRDTHMVVTLKARLQIDNLGLVAHIIDIIYRVSAVFLSIVKKDADLLIKGFLDDTVKQAFGEFKEQVLSAESTMDAMFEIERNKRMSLTDIKEHYWTAYAPSYRESGQEVQVDPEQPFVDQCFPLPIEHDFDMMKIGKDYHRVIMLAMMPDVVGADYLGMLRRTVATHHTIFTNITTVNQGFEKTKLTLAAALKQRMGLIFGAEEAAIFSQEISEIKQRMFGGRKIMYMMFGMIVHGYSRKEIEDKMLRISSNFKKLSCVPDIEKSMSLQAISYSWPLVFSHEHATPFSRSRRVMSNDLVDLLPIHGHWTGHNMTPQAVYVNRDGEVIFFDHTSPDFVNWHYAITGTSGSGKSFAVVDLVLQLFAAGVERQFLMTIKDDYDRFANTMGRLILIDLDVQTSCINPFSGKITKTRLQQWVVALELMLAKGEPVEQAPGESRLLEMILQFAYDMVPEGDCLRPSWIKEAIQKFPYEGEDQRVLGMRAGDEIGSYCANGVYGALFDGFPSVTEKDKLVVFNLQNVLSEKISDAIINSIFTMLDNIMYMGERGAKKHLLVDEMVSMVSAKGGEQVANQLKRAFRTYRSLNCMCGIASQNEEDLSTDVGQAIIGNITKRLLLKPKKEMIPQLMDALGLRSERHEANIASIETKPGFYSEFYLMSPAGEVVCRLLTDRLTFALATTMPEDVAEIQQISERTGGDMWQATIEFSTMYPQGIRAFKAAQVAEAERQKRSETS